MQIFHQQPTLVGDLSLISGILMNLYQPPGPQTVLYDIYEIYLKLVLSHSPQSAE